MSIQTFKTDKFNPSLEKLIGVPYLLGGRDIKKGLDCYGFFLYFYRKYLGIKLNDLDTLDQDFKQIFQDYQSSRYWREWTKTIDPVPSCAVVMGDIKVPYHIGIYLEGDKIIHCIEKFGVVVYPVQRMIMLKFNVLGYYLHEKQV